MKWNNVRDRLPHGGKPWPTYLVVARASAGWRTIHFASFSPIYTPQEADCLKTEPCPAYWELSDGPDVPFEVTHWVSMPKLPKED